MRRIIAAVCIAVMATSLAAQRAAVLPFIRITAPLRDKTFCDGTFTLTLDGDTLLHSRAQLRYRGASSMKYDKKSIALKLLKDNGDKRNASLLGMRKDNYWILDAAAIDMSRMRNRVSTDLWLDFSHRPLWFEGHEAIANGTRGQFVEVYVNDDYQGIFCLTERVDRKQLGLEKWDDDTRTIHGYMVKAVSYSSNTALSNSDNRSANDSLARWGGFEASYPDAADGEPWTWKHATALLNRINSAGQSNREKMVNSYFDMDVLCDYVLLTLLLDAEDNTCKNFYLSHGDVDKTGNKWFYTPWDMDHSWGRRYNSAPLNADTIHANMLVANYVLRRLNSASANFFPRLRSRWRELRRSTFTEDSLMARFTRYAIILEHSGAWRRERERWRGNRICPPPIEEEMELIRQWTHRHLEVLDEYFSNNGRPPRFTLPVTYHTIDGRRVREQDLVPGRIYIVRRGHEAHKFVCNPQ